MGANNYRHVRPHIGLFGRKLILSINTLVYTVLDIVLEKQTNVNFLQNANDVSPVCTHSLDRRRRVTWWVIIALGISITSVLLSQPVGMHPNTSFIPKSQQVWAPLELEIHRADYRSITLAADEVWFACCKALGGGSKSQLNPVKIPKLPRQQMPSDIEGRRRHVVQCWITDEKFVV